MSYTPVNPNGQATSANSAPVVIASDQSALPVSLSGGATATNQTNGTQQTKLTDGTNIANVLASGTANSTGNAILTASTSQSQTFSVSSVTAGPTYDVGNYRWVSVQITSQYTGSTPTITFQSSNDGSNWYAAALVNGSSTTAIPVTSVTTTGIYQGPLQARYFRLNFTGTYSSGTAAGVIVFNSLPAVLNSYVNAVGLNTGTNSIGTVGSNSATGSAVPANAFYQAGIAKTSLPTAATAGNLTGSMLDKFGRQITIPQAPRDIVGQQATTITASTASTNILTGVASVYNDISSITFANTGTSATLVTLSDGTNSYYFYVPAGDMRGAVYQVPLPATNVNTNWTATCGTSTSSLYVTVQYIKNQ